MRNLPTVLLCLGAGGVLFSSATNAQVKEGTIDEIIVTAQKREQSVLDVPVTMDVISGDLLDTTNNTELGAL